MRNRKFWCLAAGAALVCAPAAFAQEKKRQEARTEGYLVKPAQRQFDDSLVRNLRVPDGFTVQAFATGLGKARMMAVGPDGTAYVTRPEAGDVVALVDRDGDGRSDPPKPVVTGLKEVHGIAIHQGRMYLATIKELYSADLNPDGSVGKPRQLTAGLPDGGQHANRTLLVGPDGMLYVSVGSTCNACDEPNPLHATILRAKTDGSGMQTFAHGLRNTIGFGWHPETKQMWGMDHGSDWRGDDVPPEELNRLVEGADYGWPFCWGDRQVDQHTNADPKGSTKDAHCPKTTGPALTYQAHSAPIWMEFYTGSQFPAEYRGDAFVAMRGSWNRREPVGYKVVRIRFENGTPRGFEDFLTGFLLDGGQAMFGRPVGLAVARDGALLVSDDTGGVVYRIAYGGGRAAGGRAAE
jgi:glucose/arabinose dehydrogenase